MNQTRRPTSACVLVAIIIMMAMVPRAFAADLIAPGIHAKMGAGAGQTVSRGAAAVFYNPANMIYSKFIESYLDVSFAQVSYTYQHTNVDEYDPVVVNVNAPPVTAGLTIRPWPSLTVGVAILPTASGAVQSVPSVPIELTPGKFQVADVANKQAAMKVAAGGAFRFDHYLTLGAGMFYNTEKTQILVTSPDSEDALIDALYAGSWTQFIVGARSELIERKLVLGLSYKTAVTAPYKGDILYNTSADADYEVFEGVGYTPAAIGFGTETRFGDFGIFIDYVREMWSGGRLVYKSGIGPNPTAVDFIDTNNIVGGTKLWFGKHMLTAAGGMYSANIGNGYSPDAEAAVAAGLKGDEPAINLQDASEDDGAIGGVQFGNLAAIPRIVASGGYRYKLQDHGFFETGAQYQTGTRVVPEGSAGTGQYTLKVLMLSAGMSFGF